jgi:hypothetical protein
LHAVGVGIKGAALAGSEGPKFTGDMRCLLNLGAWNLCSFDEIYSRGYSRSEKKTIPVAGFVPYVSFSRRIRETATDGRLP